jgi:hypothetical protein
MNTTHHWRRGGDWDIAAERSKVDEYGCDPFVLWILEAVADGREQCGGCRRTFQSTREVALISEWFNCEPPNVNLVAYCLPCTERYADDIADLSDHARAH